MSGVMLRIVRALAAIHHPDRGGDPATMSAITRAYHDALTVVPA